MSVITTNQNFPTSKQIPDQSIMQIFGKAAYLGNQFSLPVSATALTGTSEANLVLVINPVTSPVSLFIGVRRVSALASAAQFKFYLQPTATEGTPIVPVNLRILNGNTSKSSCSTAPTDSVRGTLVSTIECSGDNESISSEDSLIILDPGASLLVSCIPGGDTKVSLNLVWFEL